MNGNYNIELVKKQFIKKANVERKQFQIVKKNKKMITVKDIEAIYKQFLAKGINADRIGILGLNGERLTTIKSIHSGDTFNYADEEYLNGKSEDVREKLSNFFNIQIIIY